MKVVLFCGGQGMRIREAGESTPKPIVHVGDRPILWHVMKYYAHFGHKEFILCLGYRAEVIKNYLDGETEFLANYSDNLTDFDLSELINSFHQRNKTAAFLCVQPSTSCHYVSLGNGGLVEEIKTSGESDMWINGGYFV